MVKRKNKNVSLRNFIENSALRDAAVEVYLRRAYQAYTLKDLQVEGEYATWLYAAPKPKEEKEKENPMMTRVYTGKKFSQYEIFF